MGVLPRLRRRFTGSIGDSASYTLTSGADASTYTLTLVDAYATSESFGTVIVRVDREDQGDGVVRAQEVTIETTPPFPPFTETVRTSGGRHEISVPSGEGAAVFVDMQDPTTLQSVRISANINDDPRPPPFDPAAVTFEDCSMSPQEITTEESATATVTVANGNDVTAAVGLRGSIGQTAFDTASGDVPAVDRRTFSLQLDSADLPGVGEFDPTIEFTARDPATASVGTASVAGVDRGTAATALAGLGVAGVTALAVR